MNFCRSNRSGVALVITLIFLSVITIVAVAFLALSQRERASISQTLTGTEAELMVNAALDRAKADVLAHMAAYFSTNYTNTLIALGPDLTVSVAATNYANRPHWELNGTARERALTNLLEDPPPPVTRAGGEEMFYLDLNRNGRFEPSGWTVYHNLNNEPSGNHETVGDPQWIGVLARPNEFHSSSNRFIGRYAYLIIPIGRTLDINFIHNNAKRQPGTVDGFYRNEGFGTWEMNLAAFLTDLNVDAWPTYTFIDNLTSPNSGMAFDHASELLRFRYGGDYGLLDTAEEIFGATAASFFRDDGIDAYSDLIAGAGANEDYPDREWPGATTTSHFFSVHDFFNPQSPGIGNFQNRLQFASSKAGSLNSNTFYRMLAQLGTDTLPEKQTLLTTTNDSILTNKALRAELLGPINLNYYNLNFDDTNITTASQFVPWTAEEFFHVTADRLLRDHRLLDATGTRFLSVTNIQVYPTNRYTPEVHRCLQLALNIFEAQTNRPGPANARYPYYPTVLRPVFNNDGANVWIAGYEELRPGTPDANSIVTSGNWKDLSNSVDRTSLTSADRGQANKSYVYGIPVLLGARKGFPAFNEYFLRNVVQVERKIQITKTPSSSAGGSSTAITNQMFLIGVSNVVGLEAWNSYTNDYPRELTMLAAVDISLTLTNDQGGRWPPVGSVRFITNAARTIAANSWRGGEFQIPVNVTPVNRPWAMTNFLPNSVYISGPPGQFFIANTNSPVWDADNRFPAPQWVMTATNRLRFFLFEGTPQPGQNAVLIDAVGLPPTVISTNITKALQDTPDQNLAKLWNTNRVRNLPFTQLSAATEGVFQQLLISQNSALAGSFWDNYATYPTTRAAADGFLAFLRSNVQARTVVQA
ncbi:MAG: hypothetical protein L0Y58_20140, partial [Verrucomicrobia subdivision 3 bacterium]|nr:hypothetical protein [Limisphaerales bacterium]